MKTRIFLLLVGLLTFIFENVKAEVSFVEIGTIAKTAFDVIEGQVVNVECIWDDYDEAVNTLVTINITKSYKNKLKGEIVIKDIGGKIGDLITINPFQAEYKVGEDIIVCIAKKEKGLETHCFNQGKFVIHTIANKKIVQRNVDFTQLMISKNTNEKSFAKEIDYSDFLLLIEDK